MSNEDESIPQITEPSFDESEDNNPFSNSIQGINRFIEGDEAENDSEGANKYGSDENDSVLLYRSLGKSDAKKSGDSFNAIQINYQSRVTKLLKQKDEIEIQITEAGNSNEGMNNTLKKYVVYTIKLINKKDPNDEIQTRRRYSDFCSLREVLTKIFPLIIIPPIPPKNYLNFTMLNGLVNQANANANGNNSNSKESISTYSYINSKHLNKSKLVEHRKRLLGNFLNNCLEIPKIRNLGFFAKFLDPNANWTDEISLITSKLPKSIYLLNPENGLKTDAIYNNLPNPSGSHTMSFLKGNKKKIANKTNKFLSSSENNTAVNENSNSDSPYIIKTSNLDDINKRIMENFIGLSNDYNELGTAFNSFSLILSESSGSPKIQDDDEVKLNILFDKIGQIFDRSYITINSMINDLETKFSEPLGEIVQFSDVLHFIVKFQSKKLRQKKMVDQDLIEKKKELEELIKAEEEFERIEGALNNQAIAKNLKYDLSGTNSSNGQDSSRVTAHSSSSKYKLFSGMYSFKKITQYLTDIIDQNPEEARKQRISTLETKIALLEKCQKVLLQDINFITVELNANFKEFHGKQLKIIYEILMSYNNFLISWAKKNIEIWEEIKVDVEKI